VGNVLLADNRMRVTAWQIGSRSDPRVSKALFNGIVFGSKLGENKLWECLQVADAVKFCALLQVS